MGDFLDKLRNHGPYIVFPHKGDAYVCNEVSFKEAQIANVIIAVHTMEVLKNRFGPNGRLKPNIPFLDTSARKKIKEEIQKMQRKTDW